MKIAILTQPLWTNYGGILQAYALQTILKRMGHQVVVVNRDFYWDGGSKLSVKSLIVRVGSFIKTFIRIYVLRKEGYILMNPLSPYYHSKRSNIDPLPFVRKYINQSLDIRTSAKLHKYFKQQKFDLYVVGSDQVWRPCYSPCITDFFLKEVPSDPKAIKISYAASFGTDVWEYSVEDTKKCSELLKSFDAISVREASGIKLCKDYLGVNAIHVLDPTMLLEVEEYIRLIQRAKTQVSAGDVFCYVLDQNPEVEHIISSIEQDGYKSFYAGLDPNKHKLSVEQWLRSFYDAKFVVTDSFHACVFSILFGKPFVVIKNKERGTTRLDSLLEMFHLNYCVVESYPEYVQRRKDLWESYDVKETRWILQIWREKSNNFFRSVDLI